MKSEDQLRAYVIDLFRLQFGWIITSKDVYWLEKLIITNEYLLKYLFIQI